MVGAIVLPPSTTIVWPVTKAPAGEARNTAAPAISSGSAIRRRGVRSVVRRNVAGSSQSRRAKSVRTMPGAIVFARMLSATVLDREVPGQLHLGSLGDRIGAEDVGADQAADRGDEDDRAAPLRTASTGTTILASQWLDNTFDAKTLSKAGSGRSAIGPAHGLTAAFAIKTSTASERRDRAVDQSLQLVLVPDVARDGHRCAGVRTIDVLGCGVTRLGPATGHDHARAVLGEATGDSQTDASGRPGDDGDPAREVEEASACPGLHTRAIH